MSIHINNSKNQAEHDQLDVTVDGSWSADISSWPRVPIETACGNDRTLKYPPVLQHNHGKSTICKWVSYWNRGNFHCYYVRLLEENTFWVVLLQSSGAILVFITQVNTHTKTQTHRGIHCHFFYISRPTFPFYWCFLVPFSERLKLTQALPSRENCSFFFPLGPPQNWGLFSGIII